MKRKFKFVSILLIFTGFTFTSCKENSTLFVGGFTGKEVEKGFSVFEFNSRSGELNLVSDADVGPSPSYFCFSAKNQLFYLINEVMEFRGTFGGGLSTFKYNAATGQMQKQNEILIPYGGPCFISMSPDSGFLFVANYPNGSVAVVRLDNSGIPESISDTILYNKAEPDASHAHMILNDPSGRNIYVTDLGLDRIVAYDFDTREGRLIQRQNGIATVPEGYGPRHFTFGPDGTKLYLINELGSKMMVFDIGGGDGFRLLQTLPTVKEGSEVNNYCADVHISSDGKYLYGSNRGDNSIVTFTIGADGLLSLAGYTSCGGDWPRNFVIDPSGKWLLVGNQKSNYISVLRIDNKTGLPSEVVKNVPVNSPACLKFY
jgi:6-phosphogluconolactonase